MGNHQTGTQDPLPLGTRGKGKEEEAGLWSQAADWDLCTGSAESSSELGRRTGRGRADFTGRTPPAPRWALTMDSTQSLRLEIASPHLLYR